MKLERTLQVTASPEQVRALLADEETLLGLFPDAKTEVVDRDEGRTTIHARFRALGREAEATFHFRWDPEGNLAFEKVCDGKVWKQLAGGVTARPGAGGTRVRIHMDGRTKAFVPELTIKLPMELQLDQMADALRGQLDA